MTKPAAIKNFYENSELVAITKELADALRKNRTIDWQKRESARAKMRVMVKRLLKKHHYPPEGMDDAAATVIEQCERWTDNQDMDDRAGAVSTGLADYDALSGHPLPMAAEDTAPYGIKKEDI